MLLSSSIIDAPLVPRDHPVLQITVQAVEVDARSLGAGHGSIHWLMLFPSKETLHVVRHVDRKGNVARELYNGWSGADAFDVYLHPFMYGRMSEFEGIETD